ncbi:putative F-box/FBD/LRR-repeat protein At5g44950 [Papaver somniferum]|uniref:putative F-box/FBD/LRR-repeat protein At5g44950 n=1 Tax=Papaver somniferum TaxID=3469 RepID=UPI000E6F6CB2|nr:putative F-box/FBD/LRR-repeat protein At5g44950 [Papaver somniferum]
MNVLCISAPALKWLSFDAENASGSLDDIRVEIHAPNLLFFRYWEYVKRSYDLRNFTSLTYAEIDMFVDMSPFTREQIYHSARELLGGLSNVDHLKLSVDVFDALSFEGYRINNLPKFYNLTYLEATFMFSCSSNGVLLDLLEISPNLESLVFSEGLNPSESDDDDTWKLNLMTPCLLPKLKSIEVQIFKGTSRELVLVIQFLRDARVLQRMNIKFSSSLSITQKNKAMEQLLTFPRGSPGCVVNFL